MQDHIKVYFTDYYDSVDFSHWQKKIRYNSVKLRSLKTDEARKGYLLELYSAYLQLTEILLTNIKICTTREKDFLSNLFIGNWRLREFFEKSIKDPNFFKWFLDNYDFGIVEKSSINNFRQKYDEHEAILKEAIEDYLKDYDFLNAYKHGYRVRSSTKNQSISLGLGKGQAINLAVYDSLLVYLTKRRDPKDKSRQLICENTIGLKLHRVTVKAAFMTAMLENIKAVLAAQREGGNKQIKINHFFLTDKNMWDESFGSYRWSDVLFPASKS